MAKTASDKRYNELFAKKITYLRNKFNLTRSQFAALMGVVPGSCDLWERGQVVPSTVAMYKLFKYPQFRVYLEWFFDDTPITELDNFQCIVSARSQEPNEDTNDIQGQNSSMKPRRAH